MELDKLGQNLNQALNNSESWLRQAEQQLLVAESISPKLRSPYDRTQIDLLLRVGYLNTTLLLIALAVENSLKAIDAAAGKYIINNGRAKVRGGKNGHDLLALAQDTGFKLTNSEKELLKKLTQITVWAGKYHAPIKEKEFEQSNIENPKHLTMPKDLIIAREIFTKAAEQCGVKPLLDEHHQS